MRLMGELPKLHIDILHEKVSLPLISMPFLPIVQYVPLFGREKLNFN